MLLNRAQAIVVDVILGQRSLSYPDELHARVGFGLDAKEPDRIEG
jgi:hypothetical protein